MKNRDDWADDPTFREYAEHVIENVLPHMKESAVFLTIAPTGGVADVKQAVEIGFMILMDKPMIVVAPPGRHVAERLLRVADHVITADISTDEGRKQIAAAIKALTNQ